MLALTLKYRPQDFDSLEGQAMTKNILKNASKAGKLSQAYLLTGPRGTGKTSTARIIAKAINCLDLKADGNPCNACTMCLQIKDGSLMDLIEIDAASNTGVDNIRDLIDKSRFLPSTAKKKIYIIDEVHMLSKGAFNALLKTLEEPPEHIHFILATTEFDKVPETIVSRCQTFRFLSIDREEIESRLSHICEKEGIRAEEGTLALIAHHASGGLRDAVTLLEKVVINQELKIKELHEILGQSSQEYLDQLYDKVVQADYQGILPLVEMFFVSGGTVMGFSKIWMEYLKTKLYHSVVHHTSDTHQIMRLLEISEQTLQMFQWSSVTTLPVEVLLLKCAKVFDESTQVIKSSSHQVEEIPAKQLSSVHTLLEGGNGESPMHNKPSQKDEEQQIHHPNQPPLSQFPEARAIDPPFDKGGDFPLVENQGDVRVSSDPTLSLADIRSKWSDYLSVVSAILRPILKFVTLLEFENNTLTLGITSKSYFERLDDPKNRREAETALEKTYHTPIIIKLRLTPASTSSAKSDNNLGDAQEVFSI